MASETKIFIRNIIKFLTFGFKMYEQGVCDEPIKKEFKLVDSAEMYGYTKKEASNLLGLSVRQFDRHIKSGNIPKGRKIKNLTALRWDKQTIDKLAASWRM